MWDICGWHSSNWIQCPEIVGYFIGPSRCNRRWSFLPSLNCCKNCRNNSGSRDGTASAGRKRHAVATWTGILVVRICRIFFSVGLQVLMFWFCQGVPRALSLLPRSLLLEFFLLQDFSRQWCAKRQSGQEKQKWMQQKGFSNVRMVYTLTSWNWTEWCE